MLEKKVSEDETEMSAWQQRKGSCTQEKNNVLPFKRGKENITIPFSGMGGMGMKHENTFEA